MKKGRERVSFQDIYDAYRKLKAHVYYENSSLFLRDKIAQFERTHFHADKSEKSSQEDFRKLFEDAFRPLHNMLNKSYKKGKKNGEADEGKYFKELLEKIDFIVIPKSIDAPDSPKERFITNVPSKAASIVSKCNYLIDAPIELHVLAVVWILKVGVYFNEVCSGCNYANLLNTIDPSASSVVPPAKPTKRVIDGLGLFKPYFVGYKNWRDNGLNRVLRELDDRKSAILLSLDITRYYYSARVNVAGEVEDVLDKFGIKPSSEDGRLCVDLSEFLQRVHEVYAEKLAQYINIDFDSTADKAFPLPIGLLSSGILANYYLRDFDKYITDDITPEYYGRYVDDIIMVFSGKRIEASDLGPEGSPIDSFIRKTLIRLGSSYEDKLKDSDINIMYVDDKDVEVNGNKEIKTDYVIRATHGELRIQKEKVIMEYFLPGESRVAINKFKRRLEEASSEFRLLPFESRIDEEFDNEAYNLEYKDSIQKLRSLQGISEDKYGASKFLAQKIFLSMLPFDPDEHDEDMTKKSAAQILTYFQGNIVLTMNGLWEKVATYFLVNKDIASLRKFYAQARKAIAGMEVMHEKDFVRESMVIQDRLVVNLVENLKRHLNISLAMAFALNPSSLKDFFGRKQVERYNALELNDELGEQGEPVVLKDKEEHEEDESYEAYKSISSSMMNIRQSYLFRHQYQYLRGLCYTYPSLDNEISLLGRDMLSTPIQKLVANSTFAPYLAPVFLKMEDIASIVLLNRLSEGREDGDVDE